MRLSRGGGAPQSAQHKHSKLLNPQTLQLCAYRGLAFTFERAHNIDPIHRNLSAALAPRLVNSLFVPTAEAAFIAGISDREMNRAIDERILPDSLIQSDNGRRFARLGAALAGFYFRTEDVYVAPFRRRILREVVAHLERLVSDLEPLYSLRAELSESAWQLEVNTIRVDLARFVDEATRRVKEIDRAESLVNIDRQIMGGAPVFAGTRVPVETVVASLNKGIDIGRILKAYPFLTQEHLEAAKVYAEVHPRRGRPSKTLSAMPGWKINQERPPRTRTERHR